MSKHPTPESGITQKLLFRKFVCSKPAPGAMNRLEPAHDYDEPIQSESADVVYSEVQPPEVLTKESWLLV